MSGSNTKVKKPTTVEEENAYYAEKFSVEIKDIKWIRLTYGISRTKLGELKESFLKELQQVTINPIRLDMMSNRTAYPFYDFNNKRITLPYYDRVWATKSVLSVIKRTAIFLDSDDMKNVNAKHRVADAKAKVYASESMTHAYRVSKIRNMDLSSKD